LARRFALRNDGIGWVISTAHLARLRCAANLCRAAPLIIAALCSAITIVGALVLVEVTSGITAALMTPSASLPYTRDASSSTRCVRAHHPGAVGMIARAAIPPRVVEL
jgi:hypothetical protein